jgi:hypothetical protein
MVLGVFLTPFPTRLSNSSAYHIGRVDFKEELEKPRDFGPSITTMNVLEIGLSSMPPSANGSQIPIKTTFTIELSK